MPKWAQVTAVLLCVLQCCGQISITGAQAGSTTSLTYDSYGRVMTTTDVNGYVLTYGYDALNRVTLVTYPDSTTRQNVYTNLDVTRTKDRQNRWTRYVYNAVEQLIAVIDPADRVTNYDRCLCGALKGIIDPLQHHTSWNQDLEGRVISKTFPDATTVNYTYETSTSRLKTITDAKSQVTTNTYNADDTLNQAVYTGAAVATPTVSFVYDPIYPRVSSMTDGTGTTSYTYRPVYTTGAAITGGGRLQTETGSLGATAAIGYTYDQLGRVTATAINSISNAVTYDSLGRIATAVNPLATFTYGYYGVTPRLNTVTNSVSGLKNSYSYLGTTQDLRLSDITNYKTGTTVLSKFDYTYNTEGAIATWQQQTDASTPTKWTYGYDSADQLLNAVKINTSTLAVLAQYYYGYDLGGNRTKEQIGLNVTTSSFNNLNQTTGSSAGGSLTFAGTLNKPATVTVAGNAATVDANNNFTATTTVTTGTNSVPIIATNLNGYGVTNNFQVIVPTSTAATPTYDLNGNLTNNGKGQTYTWDAKDELMSIAYSSGTYSGTHTEFTYDGMGRRVKILERAGTTIGSGTISSTKQHLWVGSNIAEERDASNAVQKRFFGQGEQISGTSYFYARDHLGSVREMVNSSGTIQSRYDYDPYGRPTLISGSLASDKQYAGMYIHATSALNLTKYRAYDSNTGKWLSRDPITEAGGVNLYAYCENNSLNFFDPLGLCPCDIGQSIRTNPGGSAAGLGLGAAGGGIVGVIATHSLYGGIVGIIAGGAVGAAYGSGYLACKTGNPDLDPNRPGSSAKNAVDIVKEYVKDVVKEIIYRL